MENNQQPQSPESNETNDSNNSNELVQSGNDLADIVAWLKLGNIVIIHANGYGRTYRIPGLKAIRKIYVNVSSFPSLLDEDEWPWYIKDAGAEEIFDTLAYEEENIVSFTI